MIQGLAAKVTPNEYLDARRPQWLDAELSGQVRFDWSNELQAGSRLVLISVSRPDIAVAVREARS